MGESLSPLLFHRQLPQDTCGSIDKIHIHDNNDICSEDLWCINIIPGVRGLHSPMVSTRAGSHGAAMMHLEMTNAE